MASLTDLFDAASDKLARNELTAADLDHLREVAVGGRPRQRLLVLHAQQPSVRATVVAAAIHEPAAGSVTEIDPMAPPIPYGTVFDAVVDGWRIIAFPEPRAHELGLLGYAFVLEKMEVYGS